MTGLEGFAVGLLGGMFLVTLMFVRHRCERCGHECGKRPGDAKRRG